MSRLALAVAVVVALSGAATPSGAGRLPKPISTIKRAKVLDNHPSASIHESRGPRAVRPGTDPLPADEERDKRRTHSIREMPPPRVQGR